MDFLSFRQGLLLVLLLLWSCGRSPEPLPQPPVPEPPPAPGSAGTPRLILLYAPCTVNKDFLSPYRRDVSYTPHLESFSKAALVFKRHQTESGQSGTAYASIFSGSQADNHGIFHHPTRLGEDVELIGEAFRRKGYDVIAWMDHSMASAELGYAQGTHEVHDTFLKAEDPRFAKVLDALVSDKDYKALLITNFTVTHGPYELARVETFCRTYGSECAAWHKRRRFDRLALLYRRNHLELSFNFPETAERLGLKPELPQMADTVEIAYKAGIAYLDSLFGGVLDQIRERDLFSECLIVFTSDHGETLFREGTHFKWIHGFQLAPEVLNVPFIVYGPGIESGSYESVTRSIDLLPTLAALADVPASDGVGRSGVDLSAALLGHDEAPDLVAYSHTNVIPKPIIERSVDWSLFHKLYPRVDPELMWFQLRRHDRVYQIRRDLDGGPEPAVFDLAVDPLELDNLFDRSDSEQKDAFRELLSYRERLVRAFHARGTAKALDLDRQEQLLRSLGYID